MSRKTKFTEPFYRSQATNERCEVHSPNRLYVSGANVVSPTKISQKLIHQNKCNSPRINNKYERAIDGITTASNYKQPSSQKEQIYTRKKYAEDVRWQSPLKILEKKEGFKSIIEEINENNDKALQQLDDDIKRIKSNLVKVQQQKAIDKKNQENETLLEQIQLLQEENERLRTKNLEMIQQKKKLSQTIDKYQAFIQQEREKQAVILSARHSNQYKSTEEFITQKLHHQERLREKQIQIERLRFQVEKLNKILDAGTRNKRQAVQAEEISRLNKKIQEIQRQLAETNLRFQQNLKSQLQKKDKHYLGLLELTRSKSEESLKKLQSSCKLEFSAQSQELLKQKERQNLKLKSQFNFLAKRQEQQRKKIQKYESEMSQFKNKSQSLSNQNEFLTFTCKQLSDRCAEKDQQKLQLQKKLNSLQTQLKKMSLQLESLDLKWQQQKKRYGLLQQLYSRLQRQSQSLGSQAQSHMYNYKKAICDYQQELNQSKYQMDSIRKNSYQLQQKLEECLKENQKIIQQNRSKNEEILCLKKEKIILLNQRDASTRVQEYYSPPKYETRERFLSGQPKSSAQLKREKEKEKQQLVHYKKLQKQLQNIIEDLRLQKQKDRTIFKQKEKGFKVVIQNQKKQIDELNSKAQTLKSETEKLRLYKLSKQEELLQIVRKKDAVILNNQLKANQLQLKIVKLQNQSNKLKQANHQQKNTAAANQSKLKKQIDQNNKQFKDKFADFLQKVIKQLKKIDETNFQMSIAKAIPFYVQQLHDFSLIIDFRKLSEFNLLVDSLNQKFTGLMKKIKQLEKRYDEKTTLQKYKTDLLSQDRFRDKFHLIETSKKSEYRLNKFLQTQKIECLQEEIGVLTQKINKLELQNERLTLSYKQVEFEKQQNEKLVSSQKREIQSLIEKNEELQKQLQFYKHKLKQFQVLLQNQKQKMKIQRGKQMSFELTPKKQMSYSQQHQYQMLNQGEILINSKIDLNRRGYLSEKRSPPKHAEKQTQKTTIQLQLIKMNYQNQLQKQTEKYEALNLQKDELDRKFRKLSEKYQQNQSKTENMEKQAESLRKKLAKYEQKIKNYENEAKVLVQQLQILNQKYLSQIQRLRVEKQEKQVRIRQLISQNQSLQRKNKKQWMQKDTQLINATQKHELKIVELQSQIASLKEKMENLKAENQSLRQKYQRNIQLFENNLLKIQQKQHLIKTLSQKLQLQKNQKQKIFNMFTINTTQLSKMLQEKEIQIQELKFIQQSTIINYHCQRNARHPKKTNQSVYSFQQQS